MNRRQFLRSLAVAGAAAIPVRYFVLPDLALALFDPAIGTARSGKTLILLELKGGNDGLNTVIPFEDPLYYKHRPNLAVPRSEVYDLGKGLGLHPAMKSLTPAWKNGDLAIALGVGYQEPNRSHFRSIDIINTASGSDLYEGQGWISNLPARDDGSDGGMIDGLVLGQDDPGPLRGRGKRNLIISDPGYFFKKAAGVPSSDAASANKSLDHILKVRNDVHESAKLLKERLKGPIKFETAFPKNKLGRNLKIAAKLLASNVSIGVIKVSHGSFDTHSGQKGPHQRLLEEMADSLSAFRNALVEAGLWDRVLVMTYSEFGRRVAENGSGGTDHGTAAPHFITGGGVRGGFYGRQPSLDDLDEGDLKFTLDYRSLYRTVAEDWWGVKSSFPGDRTFPRVPFIKS
jgi:uncharacterized protein (DUF1501 family)